MPDILPDEPDDFTPASRMAVSEFDLENLRGSGLTDATIRANRLRTEDGALVFPYRDLEGEVNCFARIRLHSPDYIGGKEVRYRQPKGTPLRAYFPAASLPLLRDYQSSIYITEGEKKALALSQLGLAAIGLGGIWCGCQKGTETLIDDLQEIYWSDRPVYLVFDWDPKASTRREVEGAKQRLARALKAAGAGEVYGVNLPPGPNGSKQGVDDYLVRHSPEGFERLVEQATPVLVQAGIASILLIPSMELGKQSLHGLMGEFVKTVSPLTEATDPCLLAHLIAAVSARIGPKVYVWGGDRQPPRFNVAVVGPTASGRKGTGFVPIRELMRQADPEFWKNQPVKGLSSGEGLIGKLSSLSDDGVVASLVGKKKSSRQYKNLMVLEPEFSKVLMQTKRDGNILSQIIREAYDSGDLSVLTKESLRVTGAHIVIVGHITPQELKKRLSAVEMANGFGNRFLWIYTDSTKSLPNSRPIPPKVLSSFARRFREVFAFTDSHDKQAEFPMDRETQERWAEEYKELCKPKSGFVGELTARGSTHVLRLSLLYALVDRSEVISLPHLEAALAVWRYSEDSVRSLFGGSTGDALEDRLYALLGGGPMMTSEFYDHVASKGVDINEALEKLEKNGLVKRVTERTGKPGRPPEKWSRV